MMATIFFKKNPMYNKPQQLTGPAGTKYSFQYGFYVKMFSIKRSWHNMDWILLPLEG